jgi:zinc protease
MCRLLLVGLILIANALAAPPEMLTLPSESPLVAFRILLRTGAASDPEGKEGVAALTAAMLSMAGTKEKTYDEIVEALFPMASSVSAQVDKEMTVFVGTTHVENLEAYYELLRSMLLEPGWREDDFRRLKDEAKNYLRIQLRSNNEEELAKEYLFLQIFEGHDYGHHSMGTIAALDKLSLDDLKSFYADNYLQGNLVIGLAGCYPERFAERVQTDFAKLPEGATRREPMAQTVSPKKLRIRIIEKDTRGTHIALGFPIPVNRSNGDWPALKLVQSYFGQHRSSKSLLFQKLREIRGMNYGDYAYIEYFPSGMYQFKPDPNLARSQQIFHIWIRPVEPRNGMFALRIVLYELNKLVEDGISAEDFEATRRFLGKFVNLLTQTQSEELGYALDSRFYGIPPFRGYVKDAWAGMTVDDVNSVIRKYLRATDLDIVIITKDAAGMRDAIRSGQASTIEYVSPPPKEILDEDKVIGRYPLDVGSIEVVPASRVFED